ncbi:MAG: hypothetical protein V1798_10410 [Pseudomonadota bacterium]
MTGMQWLVVLGLVGVVLLATRILSWGKSAKPASTAPKTDMPQDRVKVVIDGEEVELEPVPDDELERLALAATEPKPLQPEPTPPEGEAAVEEEWRDVMADPVTSGVRRSGRSSPDLRTAAAVLSKAGIQNRVAPSSNSLLGVHTLQVKDADFDRAVETLRLSEQGA